MEKIYDIILFGATGFTGQLVARYIDQYSKQENLRWAIAGRNRQKLERMQQSLISIFKPDIIIADVNDIGSIHAMTSKTKVLMNAAGPFEWYGRKVVESCVDNHTNYLDITGEPEFILDIAEDYHQKAKENKISIINCCGFDSIPADFACWMAVRELPKDKPVEARVYIRTNASFSGGTLTTAVNAIHRKLTGQRRKRHSKPRHPDAPKIKIGVYKDKEMNAWVIPMPVADVHIVKRTAELLPEEYSKAFSYGQFFLKSSFVGMLRLVIPVVFGIFMIRFKWFRQYLFRKFQPGTGPSEEQRKKTKFEAVCIAKSENKKVKAVFAGADPGYNETAKMFAESAFTLLDKIKHNSQSFGVLTPVSALGDELLIRLRNKEIRAELVR